MHKEIRYIEGNRENLVTIWRQNFFGAANVARIRPPSPPPLPDFLSATYAFLPGLPDGRDHGHFPEKLFSMFKVMIVTFSSCSVRQM